MGGKRYTTSIFILLGFLLFNVISSAVAMAQRPTKQLQSSKDYIDIIKYYRYLNPDSALYYVEEGIKKAEKNNDELGKAALLNQYGMIEDNASRYKESRNKYLEAERIYKQKNDEIGLAATLIRLSVVERRKGNYDKSLAYAMQALKISEKNNHKLGILEGRIVYSETYYALGDYENSLKYLKMAEEIDREIPLSNLSLNMYIDYGYTYIKLKEYDKAIQYLEKGLSKSNRVQYNGLKISLLKVMGIAYGQKGNMRRSVAAFKEALSLSRQIKNVLREQSTLTELAEVYETTNIDTALKYLGQALIIVDRHKMYRQQIAILDKMSDLHERKANLQKALELKKQSYKLAEQVFYKDMMKQVSSLETAYELEKSKAALATLTNKNQEQKMVKNISVSIAIGVFLVLIITLANYFRSRHLNNLLRKANKELEDSNDTKDKFFSIIAHDIRSPLASTIGILQLIDGNELDDETRSETVKKLLLHCENSLGILDKLLKWGQMQIKGTIINPTTFNPLPNINRNVALLKAAADKKQITINIDMPQNITLNADADHFDFVIRNLLANAIKFTGNNGEIAIKAKVATENSIEFSVTDNGVGISENRMEKLFQLTSIGTKGTSLEEGTSLGLIICKEFVSANEGELNVTSKLGQGTTFSFTLNGKLDA